MILSVWRAKLGPVRIEEYRRFERDRCLPMLRRQPGFLGVLFVRSVEDHAASITIWEDGGSVEALESSRSYQRTIRELAESGLLAGKQSVKILEAVSGVLRSELLSTALNPGDERSSPGGAAR